MKTAIIIPARYGSKRFEGKPLHLINGKPLIAYTLEAVKKCKTADFMAVATDDKRIHDVVRDLNVNVFMTPQECKSGTDRVAWLAKHYLQKYSVFINAQCDEPLIDSEVIDDLSATLKADKSVQYATVAFPIKDRTLAEDPNIVKVVFDNKQNALYFSRYPIPYNRDKNKIDYYKHIGVYAYKRKFLIDFIESNTSSLESAESLEQLRALENGQKVKIIISNKDSISVDVLQDIPKITKFLK
ncbi:MAG: 3-deoxy-manno-octulosonate cytidylyltransferase [Elusimicrobiota bacterium]|jgi:3-deoxy-manno-octulosonate cytidylyltransferase (CMP-KDO synthetase)|nr:3-deoxy-manno-octulosonate cytidylyltransferase [Elusimicrobiota bacterium]